MKKRLLSILLSAAISIGAASVLTSCDFLKQGGDSSITSGTGNVEGTWYEEKSGYKFCGYYEDKNFKTPVTKPITQSNAKKYYAKYQPDKVQLYEGKSVNLEHTIYSSNFNLALNAYLSEVGGIYDRSMVVRLPNFEQYGIPFKAIEIYTGKVQGFYTMKDTSNTIPFDYKHVLIPQYAGEYSRENLLQRNNTWKACVYTPTHEEDGWQAFIVNKSFAVVVGMDTADAESASDSLKIPSKIGKYPVKEVSIIGRGDYILPFAKTLTIPASVENVTIMDTYCSYPLENLIIEEGVKTVRIDSYLAKSVSLPASAYYVDFRLTDGRRDYNDFYKEQSVTVAEGGHYYTKDGILYSKEGDLCYQFANRGHINLRIDENAKRVLPQSVNGVAKNIYIPEGLEYFDLCFMRGGLRGWENRDSYSALRIVPMLLISSDKVARRLIEETTYDYGNPTIPPMLISEKLPLEEYKEEIFRLMKTYAEAANADSSEFEVIRATSDFKDCNIKGYRSFVIGEEYIVYGMPEGEYEGFVAGREFNHMTGEMRVTFYSWLGDELPDELPEGAANFDYIIYEYYSNQNETN